MTPLLALACVDSVGDPGSIWPKRSIRVCWSEESEPRHFGEIPRRAVQSIVQQEYTLARTGIEFVGWESCSTLSQGTADVQIRQSTKNLGGFFRVWGMASIGVPPDGSVPHLYLFYDQGLQPNFEMHPMEHLQMIALHEFGHLAGLRHEHARPEAKEWEEARCLTGETLDEKAESFGIYDRNSIMNYCWNQQIRVRGTGWEMPVPDAILKLPAALRLSSIRSLLDRSMKIQDPSLVHLSLNATSDRLKVRIRIGLSAGDLNTLRSLYP
jgi:hypothetical protein